MSGSSCPPGAAQWRPLSYFLFHIDGLTGPDAHILFLGEHLNLVPPVLVVHMGPGTLEEFHNVIQDFHPLIIEVSDTLDEDGDGHDGDDRKHEVKENTAHICIGFFFYYKDNTFFCIFQIFLR